MATSATSASSSSLSLPRHPSRKILFVLVLCLVFLQYLNLLQSKEGRHRLGGSLFFLQWNSLRKGSGRGGAGVSSGLDVVNRRPLLTPIDVYLRHHVDGAGHSKKDFSQDDGPFDYDADTLSLFPDVVAPSAPLVLHDNSSSLPVCPIIPSGLHGPFRVQLSPDELPASMEALEELHPDLEPGGRHRPGNCSSRHRVAVIVPYRDRELHLRTFLANIHPFLKRQQVDYSIFVVEQSNRGPFNRAMLLNVGAAEALKQRPDLQCFVFHDVDLLPEDDRNLYTCPSQPRHMSVAINSFLYHLPYDDIFGGVSAMTVGHFRQVNGFSNMFWGWGGEDDDMSNRLRQKKLYISRYPANIARYKMLKHDKDKANPDRFKYLYSGAKRMSKDGFKSLRYRRVDVQLGKLYTWILAELPHLKA